VSACGADGSGVVLSGNVKPAPMKQESSSKSTYGSICVGMDERLRQQRPANAIRKPLPRTGVFF
ncbi:MAG: hypothetical protein ACYCPX_04575, partial [Acidiferrobacteraceae bacterium]